jgi:hypothetical protein
VEAPELIGCICMAKPSDRLCKTYHIKMIKKSYIDVGERVLKEVQKNGCLRKQSYNAHIENMHPGK